MLADDDPKKLSLYWLKNNISFEEITDSPNNDAKMYFFLIKTRLDHLSNNIILTNATSDMREITTLEGYISETSLEYCLTLLFLHYNNVYPIWTETFIYWFNNNSYDKMKTQFKTTYPYSDCDIIEREANNRDITFFYPFLRRPALYHNYSLLDRR